MVGLGEWMDKGTEWTQQGTGRSLSLFLMWCREASRGERKRVRKFKAKAHDVSAPRAAQLVTRNVGERRRVGLPARHGSDLGDETLDHVPDGHARRDGVGIDDQVRIDAVATARRSIALCMRGAGVCVQITCTVHACRQSVLPLEHSNLLPKRKRSRKRVEADRSRKRSETLCSRASPCILFACVALS